MADVGVGSADGTGLIIELDNEVGESISIICVSLGDEFANEKTRQELDNFVAKLLRLRDNYFYLTDVAKVPFPTEQV